MIELARVQKQYGRKKVLQDVTFGAPAGGITLLAGKNGAGKTTCIRCALGLTQFSGSVRFDGQDCNTVRRQISFVPDEPPMYPHLTGREHIRFVTTEITQMLDLTDLLDMKAREYSLGQKRRISLAAALMRQPRYLFLDEPAIGLDPQSWANVREALHEYKKRGCSIIITGQDYNRIEQVFDRVVVLRDGSIVFEADREQIGDLETEVETWLLN